MYIFNSTEVHFDIRLRESTVAQFVCHDFSRYYSTGALKKACRGVPIFNLPRTTENVLIG